VRKPEGRPLGGRRLRWEDNIKMDLHEVGWGIDWIDLAQDRDRSTCQPGTEHSVSIKYGEFRD